MAYPTLRRVLPLPNTMPQFSMPQGMPQPARPMGGLSSSSTTEGGGQQGGGGGGMGSMLQMMAMKKALGGSAPSAVSTASSSSVGGGGAVAPVGENLGFAGSQGRYLGGAVSPNAEGAIAQPGIVTMEPLGPGGVIGGSGSVAMEPLAAPMGYGGAEAGLMGPEIGTAGAEMFGPSMAELGAGSGAAMAGSEAAAMTGAEAAAASNSWNPVGWGLMAGIVGDRLTGGDSTRAGLNALGFGSGRDGGWFDSVFRNGGLDQIGMDWVNPQNWFNFDIGL